MIQKQQDGRVGQYQILSYSSGEPQMVLGPGYCYSFFILLCMNVVTIPVLIKLFSIRYKSPAYFIVQLATILLVDLSYFFTTCLNPGIVTEQLNPSTNQYCQRCKIFKIKGQNHCDLCGICIEGYRQHCIFLGTHIGQGNYKAFLIYTISVFLWSVGMIVSGTVFFN